MHYYTLGNTGLKVSRLALGTMTFGDDWGWGASEDNARQLFNTYLEAGGNFIDTADMYTNGNSETMLGRFIKDSGTRDRVVITTKFSYNAEPGNPNAGGNGRKNILRAVEGSLQRLGTDYIDVYMLHTWDQVTPAEEVIRTFDDLVRAGKVRYVGLSDVPAWYAAQAQTLAKFTEKNWAIVTELETVAGKLERSMAQVAVNWVANRPGVASVLIGATKLHQLKDNLDALDFDIPAELQQQLDGISRPETRFPYTFFEPSLQGMINGGATVGDKPASYQQPILIQGSGAGVAASDE